MINLGFTHYLPKKSVKRCPAQTAKTSLLKLGQNFTFLMIFLIILKLLIRKERMKTLIAGLQMGVFNRPGVAGAVLQTPP